MGDYFKLDLIVAGVAGSIIWDMFLKDVVAGLKTSA